MPKRKAVTMWALACWRESNGPYIGAMFNVGVARTICEECEEKTGHCMASFPKAHRKPVRVNVEEV